MGGRCHPLPIFMLIAYNFPIYIEHIHTLFNLIESASTLRPRTNSASQYEINVYIILCTSSLGLLKAG